MSKGPSKEKILEVLGRDPNKGWDIRELLAEFELEPTNIPLREMLWMLIDDDLVEFTVERDFKIKN